MIALFHVFAIIHYLYGLYFGAEYVSEGEKLVRGFEFGGSLVYLTNINFMIQTFYFVTALLNDIVTSNSKIKQFRDFFFAVYAFPVAVQVTGFFWVLFSIDRELVFPKAMDVYLPVWFNHMIHSNVTIFILIEMMWTHHKYPSNRTMFKYLGTFIFSYLGWINYVKYHTNYWVYPILEVLDLPARCVFFAFVIAVGFGFYFVGRGLNHLVWSQQSKMPELEKID